MQDTTLEGLDVSRRRKSDTATAPSSCPRSAKERSAPALFSTERHSSAASLLRVSAILRPASISRAMFSARSI